MFNLHVNFIFNWFLLVLISYIALFYKTLFMSLVYQIPIMQRHDGHDSKVQDTLSFVLAFVTPHFKSWYRVLGDKKLGGEV